MLLLAAVTALLTTQSRAGLVEGIEPGSLIGTGKEAIVLPLKNTAVNADISGFGARVTVVQTFTNPSTVPIEAVYTFPLPADAAVDRMRMKVGDRVIDGLIKRREEARLIYTAAKNQGQAAALLDQERPNIFTQSVANILPKSTVQIEISYVQLLKYEDGQFEFSFPMVVGPRFLGNAPDPQQISPPVIPKGMRTGANISLTVRLDAGSPISEMKSVLHEITSQPLPEPRGSRNEALLGATPGVSRETITLKRKDEIPNKDFILRYRTATDTVHSAFLAKYDPLKGGYFSLILLPPQAPTRQQISPKEMVFVMDQSGSQQGFPIEKSKELTLKLINTMNPGDTFNVMGFANGVNTLWPEPKPNTAENRAAAAKFVQGLQANGGTQLRLAVEAALTPVPDPRRVRLVVFNTDGFVGDEKEIILSIRKYRGNTRMFTFGIGNSVNRYLIDAMSDEGKGDSEIVTLAEGAEAATARFVKRTQNPVLTNIYSRFEGVAVTDELPAQIPDVFGGKPIVIYGRYQAPGQGRLTLSGTMAGQPWSQTIDLMFPNDRPGGESIPTMWARRMVDKLEREYALGTRETTNRFEGQTKVTDLALEYGIMTQYTSFVAVEQRVINIGGKQRIVHVPVEMADGVSYEGILGESKVRRAVSVQSANPMVLSSLKGGTGLSAGGAINGANAGAGGGGAGGGFGLSLDSRGLNYLDYDSSSNRFVLSEKDIAKLTPEEQKKALAERRKFLFELKVDKALRSAAGEVEVEIWLKDLTPEAIQKLKALGLIVDVEDKTLKMVFGRCNAKILIELAQSEAVRRIEPIS